MRSTKDKKNAGYAKVSSLDDDDDIYSGKDDERSTGLKGLNQIPEYGATDSRGLDAAAAAPAPSRSVVQPALPRGLRAPCSSRRQWLLPAAPQGLIRPFSPAGQARSFSRRSDRTRAYVGCMCTRAFAGGAGMWSYLTFKFLNPLLNTGYLSPLQEEDLYDLPKQNSPAHNFKILEKAWALEPPPDDQGEGGAFLWRVVMRMIWKPFTMCAILQLLSTLGRFASPMLLQQMVQLIETGETEDAWHGYVIAACMLTASIIQTAFDVHYNYQMNVLGLRVRGGMMGKVFQKAMRLSEPAFQRVGVGKIVNLVQIDCMKFSWALWCVHALWAMPIMLIVAIFMLCSMLGAAGFVGLIIMVVMMPVNMRIMQGQFKYQKRITERRDERVELLTELLQGMKLIKLLGWEQQMADKLDEKRQEELKAIKTKVFLEAGSTIMWQVSLNHTQPALWLCTGLSFLSGRFFLLRLLSG